MTMSTTATLMTTMTALTVADSLTPTTRSAVTAAVTSTAGTLKTAVTGPRPPPDDRTRRGAESGRKAQAQLAEQRHEVAGPPDGDRGRAEGVLQHQVPADDPRDQLAERRIGVGVGRAGDRNAGSELGITERGEPARDAREHHREHDGRPGVRRGRLTGQDEDAGADDGADAEHGELARPEHAGQACAVRAELLRLNLFDGLGGEKGHQHAPPPACAEPMKS